MLNDAKQRNDVLSQAYATLHAEYVSLKTSQISDPSYPQQFDVPYGSGAPSNMGLTAAADGLSMDMYVYGDVNTGYAL